MSGYIGTTPVPQSTQSRQSFTATASQTTFNTSGYTAGFVDVYLNGVKLVDGTDFTATNGSDVVLTTGASASDVVDIVMFGTFEIANTSLTDATINDTLTLKNATEEDTDGGRESTIIFKGEQSGGEISTLAEIEASHDGTADDEKGDLIFRTNDGSDGSSPTEAMRISSDQKVGIGTNDPSALLNVSATYASDTTEQVRFQDNTGSKLDFFGNADGDKGIQAYADDGSTFYNLNLQPLGGNVGIGTSSPSTYNAQLVNYKDTGSGTYLGHANGSGTFPKVSAIGMGSDAVSFTHTSGGGTYALSGSAQIAAIQSAASGAPTDLAFYTNASGTVTERMRIDSSGSTQFGSFSLTGASIGVEELASGAANVMRRSSSSSTALNYHLNFYNPNGSVGTIGTSGSSTTYATSSDHRLKENVTDVTDGITRVKQLAPKRFNFIADADTTVDGFLAHEAQAVVPEAVTGTHNETEAIGNITDGEGNTVKTDVTEPDTLDEGHTWTETGTRPVYQGIDQSKLVPLLTAALQEAIAKIETLETENTTQATQIADLITRVEALEDA